MPTYCYKCSSCEDEFEIYQGIKDSAKKKCVKCGKSNLERMIYPVIGRVKSIKTLGQLAEKNTKQFGSSLDNEAEAKRIAIKTRTRELNEISRMTPTQKKKYIEG